MSKKTPYSKKMANRLAQRALDLEHAADRAANAGQWDKVKQINAEIEDLDNEMGAIGMPAYTVVLDEARKRGMKPNPTGGKSIPAKHDTPWDDEDPDAWRDHIDTGFKPFANSYTGSAKAPYTKCAHSHPLLTIVDPKTAQELSIQGGSASTPQGTYDVEIMVTDGMLPRKILPWEAQIVRLPIVDMQAPADKDEFDKLVDWTLEQMKAGKKVHVGCIGGHGRTGLFLAVLVHKITGQNDAIEWLRKVYCTKAVESQQQIDWLHKHYGLDKAEPVKKTSSWKSEAKTTKDKQAVSQLSFGQPKTHQGHRQAMPLPGRSVWGTTIIT